MDKINILKYLFILWMWPLFAGNYVVEWTPLFPTVDQPITVTFYADRGTGGLRGYTGDVYAHTGVITERSNTPSDWKYVKTNWGTNTNDTKLTWVSTDKYELSIDNIRSYYGVPDNEKILKLAFVFRSSDSKKEGKAVGGADIFIDLYDTGANIQIISPAVSHLNPFITSVDTTVTIKAMGNSIGSIVTKMELYVDDVLMTESGTDSIEYSLLLSEPGRKNVRISLLDGLNKTDTLSFHLVYNKNIIDSPIPEGIIDGINYSSSPSTVTLSLFAPYKQYVYVLGDFNNWEVHPDYFMNRHSVNEDSVHYWLTLTGLTSGEEYAFQYYVDGDIRIADPYADKILDKWNDGYILESVYPNLKEYPEGLTQFPVSILQTGQSDYVWQVEDFKKPPKENLVIYEMLVRDFVGTHAFKTIIDTLDYLQNLGVNAIELMPVNEFEGNSSWGYNPAFYFAPDKYYGIKNDLKALVDACHIRGIAVIMDIVLNHTYGQSPFVRLYNEGDYGKPTAENPWYNTDHNFMNSDAHWGYDFNHESPVTQTLVDRINRYWLSEYKFDGFRFDFTKGFGNNIKSNSDPWGSLYDADRIRLLKRMADKIWEYVPDTYVILEHLAEDKEEKELASYGMLMWANANHNFNEATMGYHGGSNSNISWTYYKNRNWSVPHMVAYMESHDEERLMVKNLLYGKGTGNYNVKTLSTALERMKAAGAFLFLIPGPKMIWQFGEMGYDVSINEGGRLGEKPLKWHYLSDVNRKNLYDTWSALIHLKKRYAVFNSTETELKTWLSSSVKKIKYTHPEMNAFLAGNFDVEQKEVELELASPGKWYNVFLGDSIDFDSEKPKIILRPGTFILLTDQLVDFPKKNITHLQTEDESRQPMFFHLFPNYPNPFNPSTTIKYQTLEPSQVTVSVHNVKGQKIMKWNLPNENPGIHQLSWDGKDFKGRSMPTGIYIYTLTAKSLINLNKFNESRKMILLK